MTRLTFGRPLAAAAVLLAGLLWSQTVLAELSSPVSTHTPRLPAGIVRVDGNSITRVLAAGPASCRQTSRAEAQAALALTNSIRAQRRLSPLSTDLKLQRAAQAHACEMAHRGVMSHRGATGTGPAARVKQSGYRPRLTAENIAAGRFDMNRVHREWAHSQGHLANILAKGVQHHGIGYAVSGDGKTIFWAAIYAGGR